MRKETLVIEAAVDGLTFRSHSVSVVKPGWRAVFNRSEDKENDEETENKGTARFDESETVPVSGRSLAKKKTMPKPLYTEATLLAAMESCGKELADEEAREAMKELGIGTPATRAAVIATLSSGNTSNVPGKHSCRPTREWPSMKPSEKCAWRTWN